MTKQLLLIVIKDEEDVAINFDNVRDVYVYSQTFSNDINVVMCMIKLHVSAYNDYSFFLVRQTNFPDITI